MLNPGASLVDIMDMKRGRTRIDEKDQRRKTNLRKRLVMAQQLVGKHVRPAVSLADELIAERREESRRESD